MGRQRGDEERRGPSKPFFIGDKNSSLSSLQEAKAGSFSRRACRGPASSRYPRAFGPAGNPNSVDSGSAI